MEKIKKIIIISFIGSILLTLNSSCRYEESSFSFTKISNRIRGQWQVDKIEKNGVETSEFPCLEERKNSIFSFYQSGVLLIDYSEDNLNISTASGSWRFGDKKKTIIISAMGKTQVINRTYTIVKFSNKELKLSYSDANGDKWTLHLGLIMSFITYGW